MRSLELNQSLQYIESLYAHEDAGLKNLRDRLVTADRWGVNIGANEGRMLQILIQISKAKKIVELGTLFGYSAVWMARALPPGGQLFTIERDHNCVRMAKKAFEECKVDDKITLLEGEAENKLAQLEGEAPFDMVFIDANKSAYVSYLEWALKCVRSGGLIIADNTLLGGRVSEPEKPDSLSTRQWEEMQKFNHMIAEDDRLTGTIIPTTEGLTIAIKN